MVLKGSKGFPASRCLARLCLTRELHAFHAPCCRLRCFTGGGPEKSKLWIKLALLAASTCSIRLSYSTTSFRHTSVARTRRLVARVSGSGFLRFVPLGSAGGGLVWGTLGAGGGGESAGTTTGFCGPCLVSFL